MSRDIASMLATAQQKFSAGQFAEATDLLQEILALDPQHGEALEGLGYIASKQGEHQRAADYLIRAMEALDASPDQLQLAAHVCQLADRHADAAALYERCLARLPDHGPSMHGAALSLAKLGENERALQYFERLTTRHPQLAEVHYNKGNLLGVMGRYDDEMAAYGKAIARKPDFVRAYVNLGVALRDQHRFDEALLQFKKALAIDPNDAGARTNRAQTNLLLGEFEHGWREYEWRWRDGTDSHGFDAAQLWTGAQALAGKTVLVHHEQGFGDTLQFVRFTDRLSAAGARVVLRVQNALLPLLQAYPGVAEVVGEDTPLPPFDYHIPLMSLAFALKVRAADLAAPEHSPQPYLARTLSALHNGRGCLAAARGDRAWASCGRAVVGISTTAIVRYHWRNSRRCSMPTPNSSPCKRTCATTTAGTLGSLYSAASCAMWPNAWRISPTRPH